MTDANYIEISDNREKNNIFIMLGIIVFTLGTFTIDSFLSSLQVETVYLILTLILFILAYLLSNKGIVVYKVEIMWFIFLIYFLINMVYHGKFIKIYFIDILAFAFIFFFLLLVKVNVNYYITSIKIMFILAIIYAFSSIFQYSNMDLYSKLILPRFSSSEAEELLLIYRRGNYTGFTWQTAFISGYIIYGLGIITFAYRYVKNKMIRILMLFSVPLLFFALFLAGKRAHLFFMIAALIITFIFSTEMKKFFSQLTKVLFGVLLGLVGLIVTFFFVSFDSESQIGKVLNRINETIEGLVTGEDITSGRVYLYEYALQLFNETPILGIGWRSFSEMSVGVINADRGSHPHNIYFQLLTELGTIGFILFMIPVIYALIKTIKLLLNYSKAFSLNMQWKVILQFSLYLQSFFLLYGLTGNLLTDRLFLYMYLFAISITLSAIRYSKNDKISGTTVKV